MAISPRWQFGNGKFILVESKVLLVKLRSQLLRVLVEAKGKFFSVEGKFLFDERLVLVERSDVSGEIPLRVVPYASDSSLFRLSKKLGHSTQNLASVRHHQDIVSADTENLEEVPR